MKNVLFFLVLFFLLMAGGGCGVYYHMPYYPGVGVNPVYDAAYWREKARLQRDARRQAEAAERERAKNDARQGIYRPW